VRGRRIFHSRQPRSAGARKGLTQLWSSTIVRAMNGHHSIFGICREIIR
jgi:hypothetical protein